MKLLPQKITKKNSHKFLWKNTPLTEEKFQQLDSKEAESEHIGKLTAQELLGLLKEIHPQIDTTEEEQNVLPLITEYIKKAGNKKVTRAGKIKINKPGDETLETKEIARFNQELDNLNQEILNTLNTSKNTSQNNNPETQSTSPEEKISYLESIFRVTPDQGIELIKLITEENSPYKELTKSDLERILEKTEQLSGSIKNGKLDRSEFETYHELLLQEAELAEDIPEVEGNTLTITSGKKMDINNIPKDKPLHLEFTNRSIEREVGLAEIMPIEVRQVEIFDPQGRLIGIASRTSPEGSFFYQRSGKDKEGNNIKFSRYAKILNNYKIKISEKGLKKAEDVKKTYSEIFNARYGKEGKNPFPENANKLKDFGSSPEKNDQKRVSLEKKTIQEIAESFDIDPSFIMSIHLAKDINIRREMFQNHETFQEILNEAKRVQEYMRLYERAENETSRDSITGKFTEDFIAFFSTTYNQNQFILAKKIGIKPHIDRIAKAYLGHELSNQIIQAGQTKYRKYTNDKDYQAFNKEIELKEQSSLSTEKVLAAWGGNIDVLKSKNTPGTAQTVDIGLLKIRSSYGEFFDKTKHNGNKGSTTLDGLKPCVVEGAKILVQNFGKLTITGGTETWIHQGGEVSHHSGRKLDFSINDKAGKALEKFITNHPNTRKTKNGNYILTTRVNGMKMKFYIHGKKGEDRHIDAAFYPTGYKNNPNDNKKTKTTKYLNKTKGKQIENNSTPETSAVRTAISVAQKSKDPYKKPKDLINNINNHTTELASIEKYCKKYNVDLKLAIGVWIKESAATKGRTNRKGFKGPMQVGKAAAQECGLTFGGDSDNLIHIGVQYLRILQDKYKNSHNINSTQNLLAAYNAGIGNVKSGKWKKFKETRDYVRRIMEMSA